METLDQAGPLSSMGSGQALSQADWEPERSAAATPLWRQIVKAAAIALAIYLAVKSAAFFGRLLKLVIGIALIAACVAGMLYSISYAGESPWTTLVGCCVSLCVGRLGWQCFPSTYVGLLSTVRDLAALVLFLLGVTTISGALLVGAAEHDPRMFSLVPFGILALILA